MRIEKSVKIQIPYNNILNDETLKTKIYTENQMALILLNIIFALKTDVKRQENEIWYKLGIKNVF